MQVSHFSVLIKSLNYWITFQFPLDQLQQWVEILCEIDQNVLFLLCYKIFESIVNSVSSLHWSNFHSCAVSKKSYLTIADFMNYFLAHAFSSVLCSLMTSFMQIWFRSIIVGKTDKTGKTVVLLGFCKDNAVAAASSDEKVLIP